MDYFSRAQSVFQAMAENPPDHLDRLVDDIFNSWDQSGKVISFGNGGSASDSLHFTTELVARMKDEPIQQPAISLNASPSNLTAISNDWSFEEVFSLQVEALADPADIIVGISTSGHSENIYRGLERANDLGARCYGLTGESGGRLSALDIDLIRVPTEMTSHVQEAHIGCLHYICSEIDRQINGPE